MCKNYPWSLQCCLCQDTFLGGLYPRSVYCGNCSVPWLFCYCCIRGMLLEPDSQCHWRNPVPLQLHYLFTYSKSCSIVSRWCQWIVWIPGNWQGATSHMIYEITDKCCFSVKEKQLNKCSSLGAFIFPPTTSGICLSQAQLSRVCEVEMSAQDHRSEWGIWYAQDAAPLHPSSVLECCQRLSESDKKENWYSRGFVESQYFWYVDSNCVCECFSRLLWGKETQEQFLV